MSANDTTGKEAKQDVLQLNSFFPYQLRRTHASINSCLGDIYEGRYGLSPSEWRVMAIIARDVQITSRDIADAATIDKVAVSRAVTRLESKRLVERKPNHDDGRSVLLVLSGEGQTLYDALSAELLEVEKSLMQGLGDSERDTLMRLLNVIEWNAKKLA